MITAPPEPSATTHALKMDNLSKLSPDLELLILDPGDADIIVDAPPVGVQCCILAARSGVFRCLFARPLVSEQDGKPMYHISELLLYDRVWRNTFMAFLGYLYNDRLNSPPLEASTC